MIEPPAERPGDFAAGAYDEGFLPDGSPRAGYEGLFAAIGVDDFADLARRCDRALAERGVVFGGDDPHRFDVDPVPRIITAAEWDGLELGLIQRARALNAFLADVYGERRVVADGVLPERVLAEADWYEPAMAGTGEAVRAHVAGPDLVRLADGGFAASRTTCERPPGSPTCWPRARRSRPSLPRPGCGRAASAAPSTGSGRRSAPPLPPASRTPASSCSPTGPPPARGTSTASCRDAWG